MNKTFILSRVEKYKLKELYSSKLFWCGVALKVTLMIFFSSEVLTKLFIPFVNDFISSGFQYPYEKFLNKGYVKSFPYPVLMLYILAVPGFIVNLFSSYTISNLDIFLYRIPLLVFDFAILLILVRWFKGGVVRLIKFYWLSPVLIYISYIHGQLDAIPIGILFIGLYFLFKKFYKTSFLIIGLGVATKTHLVMVVPFILIFLYSEKISLIRIFGYLLICIVTFCTINLGVINDPSFYKMVLFNQEQSRALKIYLNFGDTYKVYFVLFAYILLLVRGTTIKNYSRNVLIVFLGLSFAILNLLTIPSPGWYFWIIPFFSYFYAKKYRANLKLFFVLQLLYLIFFFFNPSYSFLDPINSTFNSIDSWIIDTMQRYLSLDQFNLFLSFIFTALQTFLVIVCWYIYQFGVKEMLSHKISARSYFIGVGGNSGAGKSIFSETIQKMFSPELTTIVRGDDMHRWERGDDNWEKHTHLNPKANHLYNDLSHVLTLRKGFDVFRRHYDHLTGKFTKPQRISPNKIMIFEGLHPFYLKKIRDLYDLKIYISPEENLHKHWKILRDIKKRGYSKEEVLAQLSSRDEDYIKYVETQNRHADIKIKFSANPESFIVGEC